MQDPSGDEEWIIIELISKIKKHIIPAKYASIASNPNPPRTGWDLAGHLRLRGLDIHKLRQQPGELRLQQVREDDAGAQGVAVFQALVYHRLSLLGDAPDLLSRVCLKMLCTPKPNG